MEVEPANDLFFIAHEQRTGRVRPHPRVLGVVLAAALLGELALTEHLFISTDGLVPNRMAAPPIDPLAHRMLEQLRRSAHRRAVDVWLQYFGLDAVEDVGQRLQRGLLAHRVEQPRLLRSSRVLWVPTDVNDAEWRKVRLAKALTGGLRIDLHTAFLAGLVQVSGLLGDVLWDPVTTERGRTYLSEVLAWLQHQRPDLYVLVSQADKAVGQAVLVGR
jgi:hypothetical protein